MQAESENPQAGREWSESEQAMFYVSRLVKAHSELQRQFSRVMAQVGPKTISRDPSSLATRVGALIDKLVAQQAMRDDFWIEDWKELRAEIIALAGEL